MCIPPFFSVSDYFLCTEFQEWITSLVTVFVSPLWASATSSVAETRGKKQVRRSAFSLLTSPITPSALSGRFFSLPLEFRSLRLWTHGFVMG